jgi:2-polyprenyl-6-hydroxyphenyl methylase/3-demethylubiquinone-9 3-methyltransferase
MNPTRVKFVTEKLAELDEQNKTPGNVLKGLDVLDIGCGGGLLSEVQSPLVMKILKQLTRPKSLARLGANTLAIDASENNIRIAQHHASLDPRLSGLSYRHTAAETLLEESPDRQFDVVCSMEVLEHVDNPRAFLDTCARLIKVLSHLFFVHADSD